MELIVTTELNIRGIQISQSQQLNIKLNILEVPMSRTSQLYIYFSISRIHTKIWHQNYNKANLHIKMVNEEELRIQR